VLTWDLSSTSGPDFGLIILQQTGKRANQLLPHNPVSNRLGQRYKLVCNHVSYAPALVGYADPKRLEEVVFCLGGRQVLCERDEVGNGEETDRVLVVGREFAVEGDDLRDEDVVLAIDLGSGFRKGLYQLCRH
jgi:hypothetical protein